VRCARHACARIAASLIAAAVGIAGSSASAQTLDEIIAKHLAARGGVEKLRILETVRSSVTIEARGMALPTETWAKRPNKMRRDQKLPDRVVTVAFDGTTVWSRDPAVAGGQPQAVPPPMAASTRDQASFDPLLLSYKEEGHKLELVGAEKLDGTDVHHLRVTRKNGQVEHLYLSAETGLEFRSVSTVEQGGVKAEVWTDFSDYRTVDGIQVPFSLRQSMNGKPVLQVTLTKIEFNVPIDDEVFKPTKEVPERP
jgi:outer membrane lipoprotein-sorting protein